MEARVAVRQFIESLLSRKGDDRRFSDAESLEAAGRLDSVDILDVVVFLERNYGVDFGDHFDLSELDSVDHIVTLVDTAGERKA
jgi:acyl carrier protein